MDFIIKGAAARHCKNTSERGYNVRLPPVGAGTDFIIKGAAARRLGFPVFHICQRINRHTPNQYPDIPQGKVRFHTPFQRFLSPDTAHATAHSYSR